MQLEQNPWKAWGFMGNPFDTKALSTSSALLPISKALVGRSLESNESRQLLRIISNPGGGCGIVEGDIGVGKTTFVNYHRYLWEKEAVDRLLTPCREISVYGRWDAREFLMDILGHLAHKILLLLEQQKKKPSKLLKQLQLLQQIFYHESMDIEGSFAGFGIGYGRQAQFNVPNMTESQLIFYLTDLLDEIRKMGYQGVFLHLDNLELLAQDEVERCRHLFEEIRDILQTPYLYCVFVARTGFFSQVIGPLERVRSIMGWPVRVPPLTSQEVIEAINIRYKLMAICPGKEIKPVSDTFIEKLYKLYGGKIRFVMDSLAQVSLYAVGIDVHTLQDEEAEQILWDIIKLKTDGLSPKEYECLLSAVELDDFTNDDLSRMLSMKAPNTSKIIRHLSQENLIYFVRRDGKKIYYRIMDELKVLSNLSKASKRQNKNSDSVQLFHLPAKTQERLRKLAAYLVTHDKITSRDYQNLTKVSASTAKLDIGLYIQQGILQKQGDKRGTYYLRNKNWHFS